MQKIEDKKNKVNEIVGKTLSFCKLKCKYDTTLKHDEENHKFSIVVKVNFDNSDENFIKIFDNIAFNLNQDSVIEVTNDLVFAVFKQFTIYLIEEILLFFIKKENTIFNKHTIVVHSLYEHSTYHEPITCTSVLNL